MVSNTIHCAECDIKITTKNIMIDILNLKGILRMLILIFKSLMCQENVLIITDIYDYEKLTKDELKEIKGSFNSKKNDYSLYKKKLKESDRSYL